ncbi:hypothetical protein ACJX0J_033430 [Zea mays]
MGMIHTVLCFVFTVGMAIDILLIMFFFSHVIDTPFLATCCAQISPLKHTSMLILDYSYIIELWLIIFFPGDTNMTCSWSKGCELGAYLLYSHIFMFDMPFTFAVIIGTSGQG